MWLLDCQKGTGFDPQFLQPDPHPNPELNRQTGLSSWFRLHRLHSRWGGGEGERRLGEEEKPQEGGERTERGGAKRRRSGGKESGGGGRRGQGVMDRRTEEEQ